jgi:hypothetical protein
MASAILNQKIREYDMYLLEKLNLKKNERVKILYFDNEFKKISIEEKVVSSIGKNLRVYFKGLGGERSSWPNNIIKL